MTTGASIKVETTVQRTYESNSDEVEVSGKETKDVTLTREVEDIEDMVWALEAKEHEVVYDLWQEVEDDEVFEEFGWYGYPKGDITVTASSVSYNWHDVVEHISERDNIDNIAGVYLELRRNARTPDSGYNDTLFRAFLEYIADQGIDTNQWVHGKMADMNYTGE